jgi:hypothetical protein
MEKITNFASKYKSDTRKYSCHDGNKVGGLFVTARYQKESDIQLTEEGYLISQELLKNSWR